MLELFFGQLLLASMLRLATPIIFTAMGGCFGHKASVLNIGLESFLGISAFFAMCGSYLSTNPWMGLLFGIASGMLASVIFAVFVLYFKSNPVIIGISLNLAAWGITTFLLDVIFNVRGVFIDPRIQSFKPIHIPVLKDIPWLGGILSGQNVLVYFALIAVVVCHIVLFKTPFGLRLRGVGIKEVAAQTVGVNTNKYKWIAILLGGALSGAGGAFLTLGGSSMFNENMSAGNGFLALAAIMVGDGNPLKVLLACLVFGYTSALSVTLQSIGIPSQIVLCFPYLITVIILFVSAVSGKYKYLFKADPAAAQAK